MNGILAGDIEWLNELLVAECMIFVVCTCLGGGGCKMLGT